MRAVTIVLAAFVPRRVFVSLEFCLRFSRDEIPRAMRGFRAGFCKMKFRAIFEFRAAFCEMECRADFRVRNPFQKNLHEREMRGTEKKFA